MRRTASLLGLALAVWLGAAPVSGQPFAPDDGDDEQPAEEGFNLFGQPAEENAGFNFGVEEQDTGDEELMTLAFRDASLADVIMTLQDLAGKPIRPDTTLFSSTFTLINDQPVTRKMAFDLLTATMFESGIAVIDRGTYISLTPLLQIVKGDAPFIPPGESVLGRTDSGMIAEKAYQISNGNAKNILDSIRESLPTDAKVSVNEDSNQIIVLFNIGLLQRVEKLLTQLDVSTELELETFRLRYADAEQIAQLIVDIYGATSEDESGGRGNIFQPAGRRGGQQPGQGVAVTSEIRVAFNKQHNSVSVLAERHIINQVRRQIDTEWDVPLPEGEFATRVFELQNSDAIKLRDLLRSMFAPESSGAVGIVQTDFFGGRAATATRTQGGMSGEDDVKLHRLAGQFSFEADDLKNRLIVTARSPEYMTYIENLIKQLDEEAAVDTPLLIQLRYAEAEQLAEQLNAIFAEYGTRATIRGIEQGLTERSQDSPLSQSGTGTTTEETAESQEITFWWQQAQPPTDEQPISSLIGKLRIVPIARQNAVLVMSPAEYRAAVTNLIDELDQPGRQVLIAAIVAEVRLEDDESLGIRWSSSNSIFNDANPDNQIRLLGDITGTKDDVFTKLFDTSVLSASVDLRMVLQALAQQTSVRVLSNPQIYTSDNEEAFIFDGQDIPFITDTQTTDTGQVINSFDYRQVGITLAVRPHITKEGNIDLRVNLELSSIVPGETLFGGFIVDRRETATKVTIRNRETVVISGILRKQMSEIKRKVPLLGDIPLIGLLFRSKDTSDVNSELVAFITPIISENRLEPYELSPDERRLLEEVGYDSAKLMENRIVNDMGDTLDTMPDADGNPTYIDDTDANDSTAPDSDDRFWWQNGGSN
ncbi:MAG: secretin N-terminal domain-containing protein [Phycisphaerales bacterium]